MEKKEYIDRGVLLQKNMYGNTAPITHRTYAEQLISSAPAADVVEVVHGEWDEAKYPFCNVCHRCRLVIDRTCIKMNSGKLNYCPNCGAKMDGGKHETD